MRKMKVGRMSAPGSKRRNIDLRYCRGTRMITLYVMMEYRIYVSLYGGHQELAECEEGRTRLGTKKKYHS